jgi:hypothetical protein
MHPATIEKVRRHLRKRFRNQLLDATYFYFGVD